MFFRSMKAAQDHWSGKCYLEPVCPLPFRWLYHNPCIPVKSTGFSRNLKSKQSFDFVFMHIRQKTKRTSPLQTPWIPQSLRDLLRFARQMQSALADIFHMHLVASSRSVFCLRGNSLQFPLKQESVICRFLYISHHSFIHFYIFMSKSIGLHF